MTNNDYRDKNDQVVPKTKSFKNMVMAFLIGGSICTIGQLFVEGLVNMGIKEDEAFVISSISLIFISALLTGLNTYDKIARIAGAGTLVPITGFANAVVSPALEFKSEGYIMGLGAKLFSIAGPVIVYGVTASVIYGLILYLFGLY